MFVVPTDIGIVPTTKGLQNVAVTQTLLTPFSMAIRNLLCSWIQAGGNLGDPFLVLDPISYGAFIHQLTCAIKQHDELKCNN
mgnify:CR=1 FL=1